MNTSGSPNTVIYRGFPEFPLGCEFSLLDTFVVVDFCVKRGNSVAKKKGPLHVIVRTSYRCEALPLKSYSLIEIHSSPRYHYMYPTDT